MKSYIHVPVLGSINLTRYTHVHQVPHAEHVESSKIMAKLEALVRRRRAVLRLSVHESASKVNHSGGDVQVILITVILSSFIFLLSS